MSKEKTRVEVIAKQSISKNLTRVTLAGPGLSEFPSDFEGGYIKLLIPWNQREPVKRSFTIRSFDCARKHLSLDMVSHEDKSPAAHWLSNVRVGNRVSIQGPGACKRLNQAADWFLLAGDMTALPAIAVNLELLPADAKGFAVLEVSSEEDQIEMNSPKGIKIIWVLNPTPIAMSSSLSDTVMALPWLDKQVSVWIAGEFNTSRVLRQYFRHERQVGKDFSYISCYWKIGDTNEGLKIAKKTDTEAW